MQSSKQYKGQPEKGWTDEQWLQHAWIQSHNPWIDDDDREYWKDKIKELTNDSTRNHSNN